MAASGPPKPGEPDCMSVCEMNDPITTGAPGRTSCARQMPASCSAICCESAAGIETGPIAPIRMNGVTTTIWRAAASSISEPIMRSSKRSGELALAMPNMCGSRSIASRPNAISAMAIESRAPTGLNCAVPSGLSLSV